MWQPTGYSRTLSEMHDHKFLVNVRWKPYLELSYLLRNYSVEGLFEVHITVKNYSLEMQEKFKKTCSENACKAVLIELPYGEFSTQLMTSSYHRGSLKQVHTQAYELSQIFARQGFDISRTKIEAMFSNKGVPEDDEEAESLSPENYFEFHIKVPIRNDDNLETIHRICKEHNAHLSRNGFKKIDQNSSQRFVTQRMYGMGRKVAAERFNKCVEDLKSAGYPILSTQREYAVFDSNIGIDKGWIDKKLLDQDLENKPRLINRPRLELFSS